MKFFKDHIISVLVIVGLTSMLGLTIAQYFVLIKSVEANRLLFEQKMGSWSPKI